MIPECKSFWRRRGARSFLACSILVVCAVSATRSARAENWPQWRGPGRNAVSSETGLPVQWSPERGIRWKVALPGNGVSSPVIWEDRVFITSAQGLDQSDLSILCLSRLNGKLLWQLRLWGSAPTLHHASKSDMATPTPITDGRCVYAVFGTGDVFCVDVDGNLVWQRSLANEFGPFENRFGYTSSPALFEDLLLLQCDHYGDSYVLAIDRSTGRDRWKQDRPGIWHSWSSPQLAENRDGQMELVLCAAERVDAYDARNGQKLWTLPGMQRECIPTPVTGLGLLFVVSGPKGTSMAIRPGGKGEIGDTHVVWRNRRGSPYVPSPILVGEKYFLVDDAGIATCLDARTGDNLWQARLGGTFTASPIAGDGMIYFTNDNGETTVVKTGERRFVPHARNTLGEPVYASGAISGGCLFLRTPRHLYCIEGVDE